MIWVLLIVFAVLIYYFILKSDSKNSTKIFSVLSGVFLILTITPFWNDRLFMILINISVFLPFFFGALGIITGWFGVKGGIRGFLMLTNSLAIAFYLFVYLIGTAGFQQP